MFKHWVEDIEPYIGKLFQVNKEFVIVSTTPKNNERFYLAYDKRIFFKEPVLLYDIKWGNGKVLAWFLYREEPVIYNIQSQTWFIHHFKIIKA